MRVGLLCLCLSLLVSARGLASAQHADAGTVITHRYIIDGKAVSKTDFDTLVATLGGKRRTIVCAETADGGFSEYEAKTSAGKRYRIREEVRRNTTTSSATTMPE